MTRALQFTPFQNPGGGGTLSVTDKQTKDEGWKSLCLILDAFIVKRVDIQSFSWMKMTLVLLLLSVHFESLSGLPYSEFLNKALKLMTGPFKIDHSNATFCETL